MKMVQEEIRKGPWTEKEDFQLVCFVGLFGDRRWDFIAKVSGLKWRETVIGRLIWRWRIFEGPIPLTTWFCCRSEQNREKLQVTMG